MSDFNYQAYLKNNPLLKKEVKEEKLLTEEKKKDVEESAPGYKHDCAAHVMHESHGYGLCLEGRHTLVETTEGHAEVTHYDVMFKSGEIIEKIPVNELKVLTSESHTHSKYEEDDVEMEENVEEAEIELSNEEDDVDIKNEEVEEANIELSKDEMDKLHSDGEVEKGEDKISYKMKVSELKAKIKEDIISLLQEEEEDEVEVEDEVEADETEEVETTAGEGLTQDEMDIQNSLKVAYDNALEIGDEKLADQIGNTITFFTRTHVVNR